MFVNLYYIFSLGLLMCALKQIKVYTKMVSATNWNCHQRLRWPGLVSLPGFRDLMAGDHDDSRMWHRISAIELRTFARKTCN